MEFVSDDEGGPYEWFASFIGVAALTVNWPSGSAPTGVGAKTGLGLIGIPWPEPRNG